MTQSYDVTSREAVATNSAYADELTKICAPLFQFSDITTFIYRKHFIENNTFFYLCSDTKWAEYRFEHQLWAPAIATAQLKQVAEKNGITIISITNGNTEIVSRVFS